MDHVQGELGPLGVYEPYDRSGLAHSSGGFFLGGSLHVYVPVVSEARFPEAGGEEPPEGSSTGLLV